MNDPREKALERARAWLAGRGDALAGVLADARLGARPASDAEAVLAERQDAQGAVAWGDGQDGLAGSLRALHWLRSLGRGDGRVAERAAAFLAGRQAADGGWSAADAADRDLATARCLAALACTSRVRASALSRAADFLAARWSVDALAAGGEAAVCAWFPALCHAHLEIADEALQWCGRELERGFRTGRFAPLAVARVFADCDAHALPGARLGAEEALAALLDAQDDDGSFGGDAEATLEAIRAIHFLIAATPRRAAAC